MTFGRTEDRKLEAANMEALLLADGAYIRDRHRELEEEARLAAHERKGGSKDDASVAEDSSSSVELTDLERETLDRWHIVQRAISLDARWPMSQLRKKLVVLEAVLERLYAPDGGIPCVTSPSNKSFGWHGAALTSPSRSSAADSNSPVPFKDLPLPTQIALRIFFRACQSLRDPAKLATNSRLSVQIASKLPSILANMPSCVLSPGVVDDTSAESEECANVWSVFQQLFQLFAELLGLPCVSASSDGCTSTSAVQDELVYLTANERAIVITAYVALSLKWGRLRHLLTGLRLLLESGNELSASHFAPLVPLFHDLVTATVEHPLSAFTQEEQCCGYLMSFGKGDHGKLGHGQCTHVSCQEGNCTENKVVPTVIAATRDISFKKIDSLSTHSIAITAKGEAVSWGNGDKYRLGHGSSTKEYTPRTIDFLSLKGRVRDLACGLGHTLALMESGELYAWGNGSNGRLGTGDTSDRSNPTKVALPASTAKVGLRDGVETPERSTVADESLRFRHIFCGASHSLGLSWDGRAFCWGKNNQGQCGHGHTNDQWTIQEIESFRNNDDEEAEYVVHAAGGWEHTLFCTASGRVYSCGCGYKDSRRAGIPPVLGHGDCDRRLEPTLVEALEDSREEFVKVACGWDHSLAVSASGRVYTWGSGTNGKLGHGDEENCDIPTLVRSMEGEQVKEAKAGCEHTVLLTHDHELWTCGQGDSGRLGHGDNQTRKYPTKVELFAQSGLKPVAIAVGDKYNLVLVDDGDGQCETDEQSERQAIPRVSYHEATLTGEQRMALALSSLRILQLNLSKGLNDSFATTGNAVDAENVDNGGPDLSDQDSTMKELFRHLLSDELSQQMHPVSADISNNTTGKDESAMKALMLSLLLRSSVKAGSRLEDDASPDFTHEPDCFLHILHVLQTHCFSLASQFLCQRLLWGEKIATDETHTGVCDVYPRILDSLLDYLDALFVESLAILKRLHKASCQHEEIITWRLNGSFFHVLFPSAVECLSILLKTLSRKDKYGLDGSRTIDIQMQVVERVLPKLHPMLKMLDEVSWKMHSTVAGGNQIRDENAGSDRHYIGSIDREDEERNWFVDLGDSCAILCGKLSCQLFDRSKVFKSMAMDTAGLGPIYSLVLSEGQFLPDEYALWSRSGDGALFSKPITTILNWESVGVFEVEDELVESDDLSQSVSGGNTLLSPPEIHDFLFIQFTEAELSGKSQTFWVWVVEHLSRSGEFSEVLVPSEMQHLLGVISSVAVWHLNLVPELQNCYRLYEKELTNPNADNRPASTSGKLWELFAAVFEHLKRVAQLDGPIDGNGVANAVATARFLLKLQPNSELMSPILRASHESTVFEARWKSADDFATDLIRFLNRAVDLTTLRVSIAANSVDISLLRTGLCIFHDLLRKLTSSSAKACLLAEFVDVVCTKGDPTCSRNLVKLMSNALNQLTILDQKDAKSLGKAVENLFVRVTRIISSDDSSFELKKKALIVWTVPLAVNRRDASGAVDLIAKAGIVSVVTELLLEEAGVVGTHISMNTMDHFNIVEHETGNQGVGSDRYRWLSFPSLKPGADPRLSPKMAPVKALLFAQTTAQTLGFLAWESFCAVSMVLSKSTSFGEQSPALLLRPGGSIATVQGKEPLTPRAASLSPRKRLTLPKKTIVSTIDQSIDQMSDGLFLMLQKVRDDLKRITNSVQELASVLTPPKTLARSSDNASRQHNDSRVFLLGSPVQTSMSSKHVVQIYRPDSTSDATTGVTAFTLSFWAYVDETGAMAATPHTEGDHGDDLPPDDGNMSEHTVCLLALGAGTKGDVSPESGQSACEKEDEDITFVAYTRETSAEHVSLGLSFKLEEDDEATWRSVLIRDKLPSGQWVHIATINGKVSLEVIGGDVELNELRVKALEHFPTVKLAQTKISANSGMWFYEVLLLTDGLMQIGYVDGDFTADPHQGQGVGDHFNSWAFDGFRCKKWNVNSYDYGEHWRADDVVGVLLDTDRMELSYFLNGKCLGVAFSSLPITASSQMCPAVSLNAHQSAQFNFGADKTASLLNQNQLSTSSFCHPPVFDSDEDHSRVQAVVFAVENGRAFENGAASRVDKQVEAVEDGNASESGSIISDSDSDIDEIAVQTTEYSLEARRTAEREYPDGTTDLDDGAADQRRRDLVDGLTGLGFPLEWATRCAAETNMTSDETGAVSRILEQIEQAGLGGTSRISSSSTNDEDRSLDAVRASTHWNTRISPPDVPNSQAEEKMVTDSTAFIPRDLVTPSEQSNIHELQTLGGLQSEQNAAASEDALLSKGKSDSATSNAFLASEKQGKQVDGGGHETFPPGSYDRGSVESLAVKLQLSEPLEASTEANPDLCLGDAKRDVSDLLPLGVATDSSIFVAYTRQYLLSFLLLALREEERADVYRMVRVWVLNLDSSARFLQFVRLALGLESRDTMVEFGLIYEESATSEQAIHDGDVASSTSIMSLESKPYGANFPGQLSADTSESCPARMLPSKGTFTIRNLLPDTKYLLRLVPVHTLEVQIDRSVGDPECDPPSATELILQTPPEPQFELDGDTAGTNLVLFNRNLSAKNTANKKWHSVRGSVAFDDGVHQWHVRLDTCVSKNIFIGVCTAQASMENYIGSDAYGYGFLANKAVWHNKAKIHSYGEIFKQGDLIQVTLDCNAKTLAFSRNGEYLGIAATNLHVSNSRNSTASLSNKSGSEGSCKWYPAVSMYNKDDKVTLIPPSPASMFSKQQGRPQNASVFELIGAMQNVLAYKNHVEVAKSTGVVPVGALFAKAFEVSERWKRGELIFRQIAIGHVIAIDASASATSKYGLTKDDSVFTSKGQCVVLGEYRHELWYECDDGSSSTQCGAATSQVASWNLNACREMLEAPDDFPVHRHHKHKLESADPPTSEGAGSDLHGEGEKYSLQSFIDFQKHWGDDCISVFESDAKLITLLDSIAMSRGLSSPLLLSFSDISTALLLEKVALDRQETKDLSTGPLSDHVITRIGLLLHVNQCLYNVVRLAMPNKSFGHSVSSVAALLNSPHWALEDPAAFTQLPALAARMLFSSQKELLINEDLRKTKTASKRAGSARELAEQEDGDPENDLLVVKVSYPSTAITTFWESHSCTSASGQRRFCLTAASETSIFAQVAQQLAAQDAKEWRHESFQPFEAIPISQTFQVLVDNSLGLKVNCEGGKTLDQESQLQQEEADDDGQQLQQPSSKQTAQYLYAFETAVREIQSPRFPLFAPIVKLNGVTTTTLQLDVNTELFSPSALAHSRVGRPKLLLWYFCFGQLLGIAWRSKLLLPLQFLTMSFWEELVNPATLIEDELFENEHHKRNKDRARRAAIHAIAEALADGRDHPDACFPVVVAVNQRSRRLHLPAYSSAQMLRHKLLLAMTNVPLM
ncbi:hypothetical protein BBJ28_00003973 [Nothophytophthora sp. Chile5]|nr:hypothetical protein BBJ28_00003973 [Nothophytophthora sp. Chile5]